MASSPDDTATLQSRLLELLGGSWIAQALYVASQLGLADLLRSGPRTSQDLASESGAHEPSLKRLLRALTTLEICRELEDGSFELMPLGRLLSENTEGSLHAWTLWWGGHLWPVFGNLLYSVQTGKSARSLLHGTEGFAHLERDQEAAGIFNAALAELTSMVAAAVAEVVDFSSCRRVVDVGGGSGELLARILKANPGLSGVLFDLPHAVSGAEQHLRQAGVAERCEFASGDFFASVPADADVYLLKSVLHDWDDAQSRVILENCRGALPAHGRVVIIEQILPDKLSPSQSHRSLVKSDLLMLVALASKERTEGEFEELLASAGLRSTSIQPAGPSFSVIEAVDAQA